MNDREQIKFSSEQKPEAEGKKEAPTTQETPEVLRDRMEKQATGDVAIFRKEGNQRLGTIETRAVSEGLAIDHGDKAALNGLNQEAENACQELMGEISDRKSSSAEIETRSSQDGENNIRDFAKRYSSFRRSEVAAQILQMRKEYAAKKEQTQQQNLEIQEQKAKLTQEIEIAKERMEKIEKIISDFEKSIQEQQSKLWYKFTNLFVQRELDDERVLKIAQEKLTQTQEEAREKATLLDETKEVILESAGLEEAKKELKSFYSEQSAIKSRFEEEREQRDLARVSKEKGVAFIHGLPLDNFEMNNTSANNAVIDSQNVDAQSKIQMIMGLEPTLSTSTVNEGAKYNKGMMYPFGVILKGGEVVSAYRGDAGTEALGLYARKSKYDNDLDQSVIQKDISQKIDESIENPLEAGTMTSDLSGLGYNEIVVENPKISGLYINLENASSKLLDISQIKVISENLGLPVIGLKDGKMFDLINGGKEITLDEILESGSNLNDQERLAMADNAIESVFSKNGAIPLEAKRKLEKLRKSSLFENQAKAEQSNEPHEVSLLNAKEIEQRSLIANWTERIFSSTDYQNGDDLVAAAQEQLKGGGTAIIAELFNGKTSGECLTLIQKFREDKNKLDYFFDKTKYNIRF